MHGCTRHHKGPPRTWRSLGLLAGLLLIGCSDRSHDRAGPATPDASDPTPAIAPRPKVLLVNSYHRGYDWTDGIVQAVCDTFEIRHDQQGHLDDSRSPVSMRILYMDSKREPGAERIAGAAKTAREAIDTWQPDVVITSDDNAAKYLIVPHFKHSSIPFVFCGVNWDATGYGFPCSNVTGMVEVQLIDQLVATLQPYATGMRIALIKGDDPSARREAAFFEAQLGRTVDKRFVRSFAEWQHQYTRLQDEADLLLLGNAASIPDWDPLAAKATIAKVTRIPTGNWDLWMAPYSLLTLATLPEEQGVWAAQTARQILTGTPPTELAMATNQKARIYLNMELARAQGIVFPMELIEQAIFVGER